MGRVACLPGRGQAVADPSGLQHRVFFAGCHQRTPLEARLAPAVAAGFTAVSAWPGDVLRADRVALGQAVRAAGLVLTDMECIGNWLPGHAAAEGGWARAMRAATPEKLIGLAAELGARSVSVVELQGQAWDPAVVVPAFARICDLAAAHGLTVAIEHVPVGAVHSFAIARELVERAERPNAGIMVDSWHFFRSGSSLDDLARCPGELIHSVQLSDAVAEPEADLNAGMVRRLMPGEGALDLAGFMAALAATGTRAPIGVETFMAELDALDIATVAARCARALDACLDLVA